MVAAPSIDQDDRQSTIGQQLLLAFVRFRPEADRSTGSTKPKTGVIRLL